ncbi:MAG: hypothetical protein O3B72_00645 [Proteobacteria bacterium]|nr:hypothetical protein [Pseudomonadota bacterium]
MTAEENWQELISTAWSRRETLRQETGIDCFRVRHGDEEVPLTVRRAM